MPQWIKLHNKNTLYCGKYLDYEKINLNINELDMDVEDKVKVRSTWTYDDERKLLEELLTSRFNFMVLFATLFMSVIVQSNSPIIRLFSLDFRNLDLGFDFHNHGENRRQTPRHVEFIQIPKT